MRDFLRRTGEWLFRHRGVVPLALLPAYIWAVRSVELAEWHSDKHLELLYQLAGLGVAALGLALRVAVSGTAPHGTSGRNTARHEAAVLNTTGLYSVMRHPLYLANYFIVIGCTMFTGSWWLPAAVTFVYWPHYTWIIYSEELFLLQTFGEPYREWRSRTPACYPRLSLWRPPGLRFSWRTAARKEYDSVLLIGVFCGLSEVIGDLFFDPIRTIEAGWGGFALACALIALTLRSIKRKTRWLRVEGR